MFPLPGEGEGVSVARGWGSLPGSSLREREIEWR